MDSAQSLTLRSNNQWYHYNEKDAVLVFVHGVLSDSRKCWSSEDKETGRVSCYWPELIRSDARFQDIGIYLGGYHTNLDSGDFPIQQCAEQVFSYLRTPDTSLHPPVMDKKKMTFVCHSMGGIVVRYLLCERWDEFKEKQVGIVLIASPSYGSKLANNLDRVIYLYNHEQGKQLRWGSETLKELDQRFRNIKESRRIANLSGLELFENRFIVHWKWFPWFARTKVVTEQSAVRYFGYAKQIGGSDHSSICKPKAMEDPVHQYLLEFLREQDLLPSQEAPADVIVDDRPPKFFYYISRQKMLMLSDQFASLPKGTTLVSETLYVIESLLHSHAVVSLEEKMKSANTDKYVKDRGIWRQGLFNFLATGTAVVTFIAWRQFGSVLILLVGSPNNILGDQIVKDGMHVPGTSGALLEVLSFIKGTLATDEARSVIVGGELPFYGSYQGENTHTLAESAVDLAPNSINVAVWPKDQETDYRGYFDWNTFNEDKIASFCKRYLSDLPQTRIETIFKVYNVYKQDIEDDEYNINTVVVGSPLYIALD
jgi:hypothetical protein